MIRKTELLLDEGDIINVLANAYDVDPDNVRIRVYTHCVQATITLEEESDRYRFQNTDLVIHYRQKE